jgi:hypothetical protein
VSGRDDGIGTIVRGDVVVLVLGSTRTEMSADAARAIATLLLTSADLAEGHEASEVDGDEPTTYSRGDA